MAIQPDVTTQRRFQPFLLVVSGIALASFVAWWWIGTNRADEAAAKQQLVDLGALVAMDADGRHVGTVNLSTIADLSKVRAAFEVAAGLHQVKAIDFNRTEIDNSDLRTIGSMTTLTSLSLKSTNVDDEGLTSLSRLQRLESLHLNDTPITDTGLQRLAPLKSLKVIDLSGPGEISDLSPIATLPELEWLLLRESKLSDAALNTLSTAPALKRLTLTDAEYSESALKDLQKRRPELSIDE